MKKSLVFSVAVLLLAVSCNEVKPDDAGETSSNELTVVIDRENGANGKATLDDTSGAFAWSRGDQIKVYDGTGIYTGTTQSTENYGLFSVEKPFNINNGSGWVVFPANIVTGITASSISITLPTSYTFSQVGSDDPDDSKAPVPMFGAYTANNKVTLKQLGAVVRIKLTNIAAGTVSFAFLTNVTGTTTIDDPSVEDPISSITADFSGAGKVITISNVPEATVGNYIFITLPVPTGTAPENIYVTNEPANGRKKRIKTIVGSSTPLTRAQGYKLASSPETIYITPHFQINAEGDCVVLAGGNLMAQINELTYPTATVSAWKFGGAFEMIGGGTTDGNYLFTNDDEACEGKWIDMFMFQGISTDVEYRNHGVVAAASGSRYYGSGTNETVYAGCWETDTNNANPSTNGGIYISNGLSYTWKPLTYEEWEYILEERPGATVGDTDGWRFSRVTVAGIQGLLLFPDNLVWKTSGSKNVNDTDNTDLDAVAVAAGLPEDNCTVGETTYDFERSYSSEQWITMEESGNSLHTLSWSN